MNATRQDAWTEDEDVILADTVLRYIREGKTQLEAFKEVAKQLSRTSAACGFRWNATIRKQYQEEIQRAKEERKLGGRKVFWTEDGLKLDQEKDTIESAIMLLEKMKSNFAEHQDIAKKEQEKLLKKLEEENKKLKIQLQRYENAWEEMGNLWKWIKDK
ncbi:RsfA family transcriptional regulator [Ornithinibacillus sp. BX22]|uniref:RsfA family transcriptional regulator n=2 Tax=Ornithinibacillus TaxID=484508 RepID=A0A923L3N2_9BACI|nr:MULTISPECIES: RsfA family transcriptional regulator [Ornithinibacillus]MBC5635862.1 RsfA family transcriptional regulator [Ornithinibacillus hominis]MBS3680149.1 RsfA family transcriptional regulator [Ornithinibacillus massiliensis]